MKRNYQEDAEDPQARTDALDRKLPALEMLIAELEQREFELREQVLNP